MNKIVPFKKEILFDTGINEIISISLEHDFHIKENNLIEGDFYINGEYKLTENSINIDKFDKKVPFTIDIGENYSLEEVSVDIDDFYYEIINNNYLTVNIDLLLKNLVEKPILEREDYFEEILEEENELIEERCIEEEKEEIMVEKEEPYIFKEEELLDTPNIFNNDLSDNSYSTYKVHIVKENESLEAIITKYEVDKDLFRKYNHLENINVGDKLIIPTNVRN